MPFPDLRTAKLSQGSAIETFAGRMTLIFLCFLRLQDARHRIFVPNLSQTIPLPLPIHK